MLFLLFGSSAAGKTAALDALRGSDGTLAVHDFDDIGVPPEADTAWRHRSDEEWVRRALAYQADGTDLLLAGHTPLGELIATPSASALDAVSACLLDCDDEIRVARLEARGADWLARSGGSLDDFVNWAAWMRRHAADPRHRPDVIGAGITESVMRWCRWSGWASGDPRWRVHVVDSSALAVDEVAEDLRSWIEAERALLRSGAHPLTGATIVA